jgi:hypothetical protein
MLEEQHPDQRELEVLAEVEQVQLVVMLLLMLEDLEVQDHLHGQEIVH